MPSHPRASFRSAAIGRCHGNFNKIGSEALVHFYPIDARKLWRANAAIARAKGNIKPEDLVEIVNDGLPASAQTNIVELGQLMSAAGLPTSIEISDEPGSPSGQEQMSRVQYASPALAQPDVEAEERGFAKSLWKSIQVLSVMEKKVLKLRGVQF